MTKGPDEAFSRLLQQCHEAVVDADGEAAAASLPPETDDELADRLQRGAYCLEMLEFRRRWRPAAPTAGPKIVTPEAFSSPDALGWPQLSEEPLPLEHLGHFRIVCELGRGGHGIVFLANDEMLNRRVALKVPRPECLLSAQMRKRFLREAHAAARLAHPHLLAVYESGEDGPLCYLASAYCTGPTLASWLNARKHPVPERLAAQIVAALADAMAYAHARGVLHRDIKPANIFLDASPRGFVPVTEEATSLCVPKLGDFGLARLADDIGEATRSGALIGTPSYMAPEQARGEHDKVGPATDVYGLGTVLFELLAGRPPFRGRNDADTLRQVVTDDTPDVRWLRGDVARDLGAICRRAIEKDPARRYADPAELAADLERFLSGRPTHARPIPPVERLTKWARQRPALATLVTVSAVAILAMLGMSIRHNREITRLLRIAEQEREAAMRSAELANQRAFEARRNAYAGDLHRAHEALVSASGNEAWRLLEAHRPSAGQPDMRDFAWWYLKNLSEEAVVLTNHNQALTAVAASHDGRILATADGRGVIRLWDAATRKLTAELRGHKLGEVHALAFSLDDRVLLSAGNDTLVRRWQMPDGAKLPGLRGMTGWNSDVEFSPDGRLIAACGNDRAIRLWDSATGQGTGTLKGHTDVVRALAFADDNTLFSASEDGTVRVWDIAQQAPHERVTEGIVSNLSHSYIYALTRQGDGQAIVGAVFGGGSLAWPLDEEAFGTQIEGPRDVPQPRCVASDPWGTVAFGSVVGSIHFIHFGRVNSDSIDEFRPRHGHAGRISGVAYVPGADAILTAGSDGRARLFSLPWRLRDRDGAIVELPRSVRLEWCGPLLVCSCVGRRCYVIDLDKRQIVFEYETRRGAVPAKAAAKAGLLIAVEAEQELVALRMNEGATPRWTYQLLGERNSFDVDLAESVVAASSRRDLLILDLPTGRLQHRCVHPTEISDIRFIPHSTLVVTSAFDGVIRVWDSATGQLAYQHQGTGQVIHDLAVSRDGQRIASRSNVAFQVWQRSDWQLLGEVPHSEEPHSFALVGAGDVIVTQVDRGLRVLRVADGAELLDLRGSHPVAVMALSPDGQQIVTQTERGFDFLDGRRRAEESPGGSAP